MDQDPSFGTENFGRWTKLTPIQNVYEHTAQVFSWFGNCEFTPTDAAEASHPDVFGETMCFPDRIWSHSGSVAGTDVLNIGQAQGPGVLGSLGDGVWVQSKFDLHLFRGQRVKFRWIGQSWEMSDGWDSYLEPPGQAAPFDLGTADDGWWIDSIQISCAVTAQSTPLVESTTIPITSQIPSSAAQYCDESFGTSICFGQSKCTSSSRIEAYGNPRLMQLLNVAHYAVDLSTP